MLRCGQDLHEYFHENVICDHVNMFICVDVKIRRWEDVKVLVARDREGTLYRRC